MANRYWVGGSASWDATAGTKWALTSGGAGGQAVPTSSDDVFFDANSGASTIQTNVNVCRNLDLTGFTGSLFTMFSPSLTISGSLTLNATGAHLGDGWDNVTFNSTSSGNTITTNGNLTAVNSGIFFSGAGGVWTLQDAWTDSSLKINLTSGTLDLNNKNTSFLTMAVTGTLARTLTMGSGTMSLSAPSPFDATTKTNLTFNANTSTIKVLSTSGVTFAGNGLTFNNIWFSKGTSTTAIILTGTNTFANFKDDGTGTHTITFPNVTTTVSSFTVSGNAGHLITLARTGGSGTFTLSSAGTITCDYLSISNSTATGGATWNAGNNSTNGGGNTGWVFAPSASTQTETGVSRISVTSSSTETGKSRISVTSSSTETGTSRISATSSKTLTGKSRVSTVPSKTITGLSRLVNQSTKTETGVSRISLTVGRTTTGISKINRTATKTVTGKSFLNTKSTKTETGVARILLPDRLKPKVDVTVASPKIDVSVSSAKLRSRVPKVVIGV